MFLLRSPKSAGSFCDVGVQSSAKYQLTDTVVRGWSKAGLDVACELIFVADNLKLLKKLKKIVSTHTHRLIIILFALTHTILKQRPQLVLLLHACTGLHNTTNCMVGGYTENYPNHGNSQNRGVGACLGQYGNKTLGFKLLRLVWSAKFVLAVDVTIYLECY